MLDDFRVHRSVHLYSVRCCLHGSSAQQWKRECFSYSSKYLPCYISTPTLLMSVTFLSSSRVCLLNWHSHELSHRLLRWDCGRSCAIEKQNRSSLCEILFLDRSLELIASGSFKMAYDGETTANAWTLILGHKKALLVTLQSYLPHQDRKKEKKFNFLL